MTRTGAVRGTPRKIRGLGEVNRDVIYPHTFENSDREVGGVMVGRIPEPGGPPVITGAIPALGATEHVASLNFTHEAWDHIHTVLSADFPGDMIVGWYHSHPGFGIFLSDQDLFIHQHFFSNPSQIALVVDPRAGTEGVFIWYDGAVAKFFERPTARPRVAGGDAPAAPSREDAAPRPYPVVALVVAGLVGLALGFGAWQVVGGDGPERSTAVGAFALPVSETWAPLAAKQPAQDQAPPAAAPTLTVESAPGPAGSEELGTP